MVARWLRLAGFLATAALAFASPALAQSWSIEGYAAWSIGRIPATGTSAVPDPGPFIATSNPQFQSRRVPSWFFGEGATQLNGALTELGATARITPLESALTAPALNHGGPTAFGVRVRRALTKRFQIEFSLDAMTSSPALTNRLLAEVEDTRASFVTAFADLFASGPFTGASGSASSSVVNAKSRDLAVTGSIVMPFGSIGSLRPYVVAGGGLLQQFGTPASVSLTGTYRATMPGGQPIQETDHMVLSFTSDRAPVAVVGFGLERAHSDHWGIRVDARVLLGPNHLRAHLDASPTVTTGTPAGFIETFTDSAIQFSNNPSTGRESSLGAPALSGFAPFSGSGIQTRVIVSVGVFRRF